jgi:hypothetical protein
MRAPVVHADEYSYLYEAHYLALGGPSPHTAGYAEALGYPGYSLLLAPLWWLSKEPAEVYRGALVINALLAGGTVVLLYALAGRLAPRLSLGTRVLGTAVVAAYPSFLLFSNLAESENLLIPGFLLVCLLAMTAFDRRRPKEWAALGAAAGLLCLVHPRAFAVLVALVAVSLWVLRPLRASWMAVASLGAGLVVSLAASAALILYSTSGVTSGPGLAHLGVVRATVFTLYDLAGQLLYLLAATVGLFVLGAFFAARVMGVTRSGLPSGDRRPLIAFIFLSLAGIWLLGSIQLAGLNVVNGRYNEAALAPILLLGVICAQDLQGSVAPRSVVRLAVIVIAAIVVCAAVVGLGRPDQTHSPAVTGDTFAINAVLTGGGWSLDAVLVASAGIVSTVAALASWRRAFVVGAAVTIGLFAPSAVTAYVHLVHGSARLASERVVPDTLARLHRQFGANEGCVGYDSTTNMPFFFYNDRLFYPSARFSPVDSAAGQLPCSDLVVSGRLDLGSSYRGARLVTVENRVAQALWVLPGALQERLSAAGQLPAPR